MDEPKQEEMEFPIVFTDVEWGKHKVSEADEERSKRFLEQVSKCPQLLLATISPSVRFRNPCKHLSIHGNIGGKLPHHNIGEVTKVQCPFCNQGCLKLAHIEPLHSGGLRGNFGHQHYVGNDYYYTCTEEHCGATFCYHNQWKHID